MTATTAYWRTNPRPPGATRCIHLADLNPGQRVYLPSVRIEEDRDEFGLRLEYRPTWHGPMVVRSVAEFGNGYAINVKPCDASKGRGLVAIHGTAVTYGAWVMEETRSLNRIDRFAARRVGLTHAEVDQIREDLAAGVSQSVTAKKFHVSQSAISAINIGRTWARRS